MSERLDHFVRNRVRTEVVVCHPSGSCRRIGGRGFRVTSRFANAEGGRRRITSRRRSRRNLLGDPKWLDRRGPLLRLAPMRIQEEMRKGSTPSSIVCVRCVGASDRTLPTYFQTSPLQGVELPRKEPRAIGRACRLGKRNQPHTTATTAGFSAVYYVRFNKAVPDIRKNAPAAAKVEV